MANEKLNVKKPALSQQPETIVEDQIDTLMANIEDAMQGDAFTFCAPITYGVDDLVREDIEAISPKRDTKRLIVLLETTGGFIEVPSGLPTPSGTTMRSSILSFQTSRCQQERS